MANKQQSRERGAVALITAMVVSVLLMITTAGMVSLTVKSLRQSTDGAQSTKAYYAAEGGLEEALLKLRTDPNYAGNCSGAESAASAQNGVVTCIKINQKPNALTGTIGADKTVQLDLSSVQGLQSIKIAWGLPAGKYDANSIPQYSSIANGSNFPARSAWPSTAPAIIEAALIEYGVDANSQLTIKDVQYYQPNFMPLSKKYGSSGINNGLNVYGYDKLATASKAPFIVSCNDPAPYQCTGGLQLAGGKKYVLRLKTRYNEASYKVTAQGGGNVALGIPGAVYTIDVTARAGDVFRRIQTSFPTGQAAPESLDGLDYVLYSDTDICKAYEIKGSTASGLNGCTAP